MSENTSVVLVMIVAILSLLAGCWFDHETEMTQIKAGNCYVIDKWNGNWTWEKCK